MCGVLAPMHMHSCVRRRAKVSPAKGAGPILFCFVRVPESCVWHLVFFFPVPTDILKHVFHVGSPVLHVVCFLVGLAKSLLVMYESLQ